MDFNLLTQNFEIVVLVGCLVAGYIIKTSLDFIPNKYIPTVLAVLGAILNGMVKGPGLEAIVYGALTGLASTGMHQAFTRFIENTSDKE